VTQLSRVKKLEQAQLTRWLRGLSDSELTDIFQRIAAERKLAIAAGTAATTLEDVMRRMTKEERELFVQLIKKGETAQETDPIERRKRIDELGLALYGYTPVERHYLTDDEFSQIQSIQAAALARKRVGV
jgi:hypothetical protein